MEESKHGLFKVVFPGQSEGNHKKNNEDHWLPDLEQNPRPPEYEA